MLLLCSPQNPTGRVFTRDELATLAQICERHDIVICSDEIHCELVLDKGLEHIPTAAPGPGRGEADHNPHGTQQNLQHTGGWVVRSPSFPMNRSAGNFCGR